MTVIFCIVLTFTLHIVYNDFVLPYTHPVLGLQSVITRLQTATSDRELIALLINWEQQQMHDQDLMESVDGFNPEDPQDVFNHLMAKVRWCIYNISQ